MLAIGLYVLIYTVIIEKGYQQFGGLVGTVSPKVKGVGTDNQTGEVFDIYDGVMPAIEQDSLFVTTKFVRTSQTRGTCPGDDRSTEACESDTDCMEGAFTENGISTGTCNTTAGFCLINTWCPLEQDDIDHWEYVNNVDNWTVFVKANVRFPDFDISRTNALDFQMNGAPTFGQNLFTVRDLIEGSNYPDSDGPIEGTGSTYEDVLDKGAIIQVTVAWNCDFDMDVNLCTPVYHLERIDDIQDSISTGFNYRLIEAFQLADGTEARDLMKLYGVRMTFENTGQGGKFNFAALTVTIGAGVALLGISTVVSDFVLEYFLPGKDLVAHKKYTVLEKSQLEDAAEHEAGHDELDNHPVTVNSKEASPRTTTSSSEDNNVKSRGAAGASSSSYQKMS